MPSERGTEEDDDSCVRLPGRPWVVEGETVLDLSGYMAGATAAPCWGIWARWSSRSSRAFRGVNRHKHGIGLDLKNPSGLGVLRRLVEGHDVARDTRSGGVTGLHPTQHGSLYISANTPHFWTALCELTGLPELARDPRFDTVRKRAEHAALIIPRLRAALQAHTALEWEARFGARVPCAAARAVEDMFDHPPVASEGILESFEHARIGRYRGMAHPVRFGASSAPASFAAPELGQHSREILVWLGYPDAKIDRLRSVGAVVGPTKGARA